MLIAIENTIVESAAETDEDSMSSQNYSDI